MSESTQQLIRAAVVALAPVVVLIGFLYHPYVGDYTDQAEIAETITDDPERWIWSNMIIVLGLGLLLLSAVAIRQMLRSAGDERWSFAALPLLIVGGGALAADVGYEASLGTVALADGDVLAVIDAAEPWVNAGYGVAFILFGLGWLGFAIAIYRSSVLPREQTWFAAAGLVVAAVGGFIPYGWATLLVAVGLIVASWLVAYRLWQEQETAEATQMSPV